MGRGKYPCRLIFEAAVLPLLSGCLLNRRGRSSALRFANHCSKRVVAKKIQVLHALTE